MPLTGRPGLPNTHVIPPGWQYHHRPVSQDAMSAECVITLPPGTPTWDDTAGRNVYPEPEAIYVGRCRVHKLGAQGPGVEASTTSVADRPVALVDYQVTIPTDTPFIPANAVVEVTACGGDPDFVGARLQVQGARRSTQTWERVLSVQMQQTTSQ
jgi:hypothetical protein